MNLRATFPVCHGICDTLVVDFSTCLVNILWSYRFGFFQAYRIIDEYLRSKQTPHQCEAHQQHGQIDRSSSATTGAGTDEISAEQRQCQTRATELAAALEAEVPMDDIADEDDDGDMLSGVVGSTGRLPEREAVVLDEEEEQLDTASRAHGDEGAVAEEEDEEDEEERETEARIAGE